MTRITRLQYSCSAAQCYVHCLQKLGCEWHCSLACWWLGLVNLAALLLGPELVCLQCAADTVVGLWAAKASNPEVHLCEIFHSQGWIDAFIQLDEQLI